MFVLQNYAVAVVFCIITMLCWGSWANTQKLAGKTWRCELFYWDYVIGVLLAALLFAVTMGNVGAEGRGFFDDLAQASPTHLGSAVLGGVALVTAAIILDAMAYRRLPGHGASRGALGLGLAVLCGILGRICLEGIQGGARGNRSADRHDVHQLHSGPDPYRCGRVLIRKNHPRLPSLAHKGGICHS